MLTFEILSEFLLDNGLNSCLSYSDQTFINKGQVSVQKFNIFRFIHIKGIPTEPLKIIKSRSEEELYTFVYINSCCRFMPKDETSKSYNLEVDKQSYFSNSFKDEVLYFDEKKEIDISIITVSKQQFQKHFSENNVIENEGFQVFQDLDQSILNKINELNNQSGYFSSIKSLSIIYQLIYEWMTTIQQRIIDKCVPHYYTSNDLDKIFRVKKYLEENYESKSQPHDMEKVTGFGYSKLRKLFKEIFGITILKYANDYKLHLAYEWLEEGSHNVSDCTYGLGFISVTHFGRLFKEKFGEPPSKIYRF